MARLTDIYNLRPQLNAAEIKALYESNSNTNGFTDSDKNLVSLVDFAPTPIITANYSALPSEQVFCNSEASGFTITLPDSGRVKITDTFKNYNQGFGANSVTLLPRNGDLIAGGPDFVLDVGGTSIVLEYISGEWRVADLGATSFKPVNWEDVENRPPIPGGSQLILPNNSRINNIEHFYQTTKPITRGDGTALVIGDRWWKIDDGTEWFWNGSYWLSVARFTRTSTTFFDVTAANGSIDFSCISPVINPPSLGIFLEGWDIVFTVGADTYIDGVNDWLIDVSLRGANPYAGVRATLALGFKLSSQITSTPGGFGTYKIGQPLAIPVSAMYGQDPGGPQNFRVGATMVGTPKRMSYCRLHITGRFYV